MRIKNLEELQSEINADITWRKKEIADFYMLCHSNSNLDCLVRACFVMVCAHFEGSIRFAFVIKIIDDYSSAIIEAAIKNIHIRPQRHQS